MSRGKLLAVCCVWLVILVLVAVVWRVFIVPARKDGLVGKTGSESAYEHVIRFGLDSFSGYAVLRSPELRNELAANGIMLELVDDGAAYTERMEGLRSYDLQMAVITIDALVKGCADIGDSPATIVAIVDETRGADAMVACKKVVPNINALNDPATKFVLVPDSPSETLARVVRASFSLDRIGPDPFIEVSEAKEVYERYEDAKPDTREVFVLWEPYVSMILKNPAMHRVADTSGFRGYIVDVIVVNRDFLVKKRDVVKAFLECYFRARHGYRDKMVELVQEDARKLKEDGILETGLSTEEAESLVKGIWWKNTQENFAHFGIRRGQKLQLVEDMIRNITKVLIRTLAITGDPTKGKPNELYHKDLLEELAGASFHPELDMETIRDETVKLGPLSAEDWERLVPIGTLEVPPLVFARGTSRLTDPSKKVLADLIKTLTTFPRYYLLVRGNASLRGDPEANKKLAQDRAKAAEKYLIDGGIDANRVRAVGVEPSGRTAVTFMLGEPPY